VPGIVCALTSCGTGNFIACLLPWIVDARRAAGPATRPGLDDDIDAIAVPPRVARSSNAAARRRGRSRRAQPAAGFAGQLVHPHSRTPVQRLAAAHGPRATPPTLARLIISAAARGGGLIIW